MACTAAASAARRSPASCRRCARSRSPTRARCSDASSADRALSTPWDARTYDRTSEPQQAWAADVLERLQGIAADATVLDVGCGTGRVTEALLALVPEGRVRAVDASPEVVELARARPGARAAVSCQDALGLELDEPVDVVFSTATL